MPNRSPADDLTPAWGSGAQAPAQITLPVFHSWEFRTGVGGDFEELVRRLQPRELPREVGKRPMSIERPGFVMQPQPAAGAPGSVLGLEGALRVVGSSPDAWADGTRVPFQTALRGLAQHAVAARHEGWSVRRSGGRTSGLRMLACGHPRGTAGRTDTVDLAGTVLAATISISIRVSARPRRWARRSSRISRNR